MTRAELIADFASWIADITDKPAPELRDETDLVEDLGLDSLALAELAAMVRKKFKIKLRPGELQDRLKVGLLVDVVLERLAGAEP